MDKSKLFSIQMAFDVMNGDFVIHLKFKLMYIQHFNIQNLLFKTCF